MSASQSVLNGMQLTLRATRLTPHGASRLVQAMSTWSVETRRAPFRHRRDARVYGHTTTARHDMSVPPPRLYMFLVVKPDVLRPGAIGIRGSMITRSMTTAMQENEDTPFLVKRLGTLTSSRTLRQLPCQHGGMELRPAVVWFHAFDPTTIPDMREYFRGYHTRQPLLTIIGAGSKTASR